MGTTVVAALFYNSTNPDSCFKDLDAIQEAFVRFVSKVPFYGAAVLCGDVHRNQASHVKGDYRVANAPIVAP